jgi:hypothetical protein
MHKYLLATLTFYRDALQEIYMTTSLAPSRLRTELFVGLVY